MGASDQRTRPLLCDPSLNPAESQQSSSLKFEFEKNENKQKEARFGPFKKL